jgi:hypothetical protein
MGLVRNLKKILSNTASRILVELFSAFIRRRAKLILKKRDNSLSTESSPNPLTQENLHTTIATSSAGTSEKIIMEITTEKLVSNIREWSIERMNEIDNNYEDATALLSEFYEWIDIKDDDDDFEVITLDKISEEEYNEYIEKTS